MVAPMVAAGVERRVRRRDAHAVRLLCQANTEKTKRYHGQLMARKLKKRWIPGAETFIVRTCMEAPGRLKELEALLKVHVADADKRARILTAILFGPAPRSSPRAAVACNARGRERYYRR